MPLTGDPVNFRSFMGIGIEAVAGTPIQALYELDFISESLRGQGEPIRRKCINRTRAVKGAVQGPYSAEGDINLEVTPDKVSTLFYAALTSLTTTGTTDPYVHVFKPGTTLKPLSVHIQRANQLFVYPGQYVSRITLRGVIDSILEATFGMQGNAKEKIYDTEQSDGAIAASALDPFVFWGATTSLHGSANTDTNNWEVSIDTGLTRAKGLGAGRAHNRAHPGDSVVTGSFDVVFDSIEAHRRWMGAASSAYPIAVADTLQTFALQLLWTQSASRKLQLDIPKAYYRTSGPAISGREGIVMQRCEFSALYNASDLADVVLTLTNGEANAAIITAATDI
jgi:hypothetical protein